jgi:ACS family sodium-dependent inorganic phosphate cotransporter
LIAFPLCGLLAEYVNWESTFYVFGGVGILYSIFWYFLVFSTPADDPRITKVNDDYVVDDILKFTHLVLDRKALY